MTNENHISQRSYGETLNMITTIDWQASLPTHDEGKTIKLWNVRNWNSSVLTPEYYLEENKNNED